MWEMPLEKLKQSSPWFCWDFKDFHTIFIPFYNRMKITYLLQLRKEKKRKYMVIPRAIFLNIHTFIKLNLKIYKF